MEPNVPKKQRKSRIKRLIVLNAVSRSPWKRPKNQELALALKQ